MRLKDKKIIVTAAAQGIGRATAMMFAKEGASVIATDINEEKINELSKENNFIKTQKLDATNKKAVEEFCSELMTETNDFYYCPYIYGFSNYSRNNYRKNILKYIDVLDLSGKGPSGTHLGGTGIAVSNVSKNKDLAIEYAFWIAGAECQKSLFYQSGGQPGNSEAWEDEKINLETNDFFKATRKTLDLAWVRPRHNGYMEFQDKSGDLINEYLQTEITAESICEKLSDMYNKSFKE
jgi:hypothetical protein